MNVYQFVCVSFPFGFESGMLDLIELQSNFSGSNTFGAIKN